MQRDKEYMLESNIQSIKSKNLINIDKLSKISI